jgi:radical SAM superfamily enzyme YgiQ (UPF0313 family)
MEHCMGLLGKRANLPVACLALLAALVPDHHEVTLIDENVEDIDFDRLGRADLVCLTGMSIQGRRLVQILEEVNSRGVMNVVGGPMATVEPEALEGLTDVIFVGEADETWPQFLREWEQGRHKSRYEQPEKTDVTRLPLPRVDLLKVNRYMFGSMQISRGCPFTCEFCDIIVTFGRLQWQQERAYPLTLFTEASLDLAEDEELMELMGVANFQNVFIGIETPNEDSLRETKKHQNVRPNAGTLLERVHRAQQHGIDVWCGMIVGFDHDDASIFDAMPKFLAEARISAALIGMLHAIPTTPLYDRLKQAGRLNDDKASDKYGTNVIPLRMSREELRDGFINVMQKSYAADAYFGRLDAQFIDENFKFTLHQLPYWARHRWAWAKRCFFNYVKFAVVVWRLLHHVKERALQERYRRQLWRVIQARGLEPHILFIYALKVVTHYHYAAIARALSQIDEGRGVITNSGRSFSRVTLTDEARAVTS